MTPAHVASSPPVASPAADSTAPVASSPPNASSPGTSSPPDTAANGQIFKGDTTWYGESCGEEECWQKGACAFVDYTLPATIDGSTCVSEVIWNSSYHCGACVEITYQGKKKIAMITNKTGGDSVHLDLSPNMFSNLEDKSLGEITTNWQYVACPITTPLEIRMHGGASQWWFAATVVNARLHTAKLEVSSDGGNTWKATTRNVNNFFTFPGSGGTNTPTAWVRVTSDTGSEVVVKDVDLTSNKSTKGASNYA
ncbi:carbohydrate-binding module family 63 protein [Exserohilum turcica Et28A]|uniref:Carbohydrate-binding module family 63 protein n=1 Tax=Exserohilum turcicum (strain 28A) TaxID=671987 RepID=R0KF67_EXST2|nr:carbohydrate-binding module family 63 protein [Exserohilum turcica Et28A]EOA86747.1 carbohydrate-binding module family 63 protein [Exserohilum turcica Et28A]